MVRNKLHWDANYAVGLSNKGKSSWTSVSSFVLEVPPRNLRPSVIYSVPCDRIVQRAYCLVNIVTANIKRVMTKSSSQPFLESRATVSKKKRCVTTQILSLFVFMFDLRRFISQNNHVKST